MKIVELLSGITTQLTNEEAKVLSLFDKHKEIMKRQLSSEELYVMTQLLKKGIVKRQIKDGKTKFTKRIRDQ